MPSQQTYRSRTWTCFLLSLLVALAVVGCDEETVGPETRGSIEGLVQDASTDDPIAGASITTSPATQSVLSSDDGTFSFNDVETGDYTVEVSKSDYESKSVTVSVGENQTASATVLLERSDDFGTQNDSLVAEVTNWYNDRVNRDSTGADSIFADVEYRVRNVGDVPVRQYEVYFRIDTPDGQFSFEVKGDSLDTGQQDLDGFRKYITDEAQAVEVEDLYFEANTD
ncbi:MAG: beta-sandwich domain-containing protein [Salinivenus sp.]